MNETRYDQLAQFLRAEDLAHYLDNNTDHETCPCEMCECIRSMLAERIAGDLTHE